MSFEHFPRKVAICPLRTTDLMWPETKVGTPYLGARETDLRQYQPL